MIRPWFDHETVSPQSTRSQLTFRASGTHFVWKKHNSSWTTVSKSNPMSPNTAPATKSDKPRSPNTAPATKRGALTVPILGDCSFTVPFLLWLFLYCSCRYPTVPLPFLSLLDCSCVFSLLFHFFTFCFLYFAFYSFYFFSIFLYAAVSLLFFFFSWLFLYEIFPFLYSLSTFHFFCVFSLLYFFFTFCCFTFLFFGSSLFFHFLTLLCLCFTSLYFYMSVLFLCFPLLYFFSLRVHFFTLLAL